MKSTAGVWQRIERAFTAPGQDVRTRLMGRLLLIALLGGLTLTLLAALYSMATLRQAQAARTLGSWVAMAFSNFLILLQLVLMVLVRRRGYSDHLARIYIGILYLSSLVIFVLTGGAYSGQVLFVVWALAVGTIFLAQTAWPLVMLGGYAVSWMGLFALAAAGYYQRPTVVTALVTLESFAVLTWLTMLSLVPVLYLIARNFYFTLQRAEATAQEVARAQEELEERMLLYQQTVAQRERAFRTLAGVQARLAEVRDLQSLLHDEVNYIADVLGFYSVNIFLVDQSRSVLVLQASSGEIYADMVKQGFQLSLQERAIVTEVARTGQPYVAQDVAQDINYKSTDPFSLTRAEAAFPIMARDTLLGVLDVQSVEPHVFDESMVSLLSALAVSLQGAIENVRQFERVQGAYERLARYQQESLTAAWRMLIQERPERLSYTYDRIAVRPGAARLETLPEAVRMAQDVMQYATPEGTYLLIVPLRVQQQIVGRVVLEAERPWLADEVTVATTVLTQLGLALENARLLDETRRRAALEQAASSITADIRAEMEIDAILQVALQELSTFFQAEAASVRLMLPES